MKRSVQDVRQRRDLMIQALNQSPSKSLTVEILAQLAKVSTMTVRRDLNLLAKMGIIERHHGYAILNEVPFFEGDTQNPHIELIKQAIAEKAATYIEEKMTIYMNTSTTAMHVMDYLKETPITVVTNNLRMSEQEMHPSSTIILSGGEIHFPKAALVGELAADSLRHINANICIMGCSGINAQVGITTGDFRESKVNQLMVQNSHGLVIVVADYRKIGVTSNFQVAGIQKIDILITDTYGDPARLKEIEEAGVTVIQIAEAS